LEDTTWAALLSQTPGCARRGTANNHRPVGEQPLFLVPRGALSPLPKNSGVREAARPCLRLLVPRAEKLTPHYPSIM